MSSEKKEEGFWDKKFYYDALETYSKDLEKVEDFGLDGEEFKAFSFLSKEDAEKMNNFVSDFQNATKTAAESEAMKNYSKGIKDFTSTADEWQNGAKDKVDEIKNGALYGLGVAKNAVESALAWGAILLDNDAANSLLDKFEEYTKNALVSGATNWLGNYKSIVGVSFNGKETPSKRDKAGLPESSEEKETSNTDTEAENQSEFSLSNYKNKEIKDLFLSGPDLFSNSFDVFLNTYSIDKNGAGNFAFISSNNSDSDTFKSFMKNTEEISVRSSHISIPMRLQNSYSQKFFNRSTEIASHGVSFENKATLSLDLDSNLNILDLIYKLNNLNLYKYSTGAELNDDGNPFLDKAETNKITSASFENKNMINLIVNSRSFSTFHQYFFNPNMQGLANNIIYIFKNIKFLGLDSISFSRDTAEIETKEFEFTFENLYTAYKLGPDLSNTTTNLSDSDNKNKIYINNPSIVMDGLHSADSDIVFIRTI